LKTQHQNLKIKARHWTRVEHKTVKQVKSFWDSFQRTAEITAKSAIEKDGIDQPENADSFVGP